MELKLTLQRIEPYESFVSETWCPPKLVPTVERMDKEFFESFLMDEFSEEVWDYFNTEFDHFNLKEKCKMVMIRKVFVIH